MLLFSNALGVGSSSAKRSGAQGSGAIILLNRNQGSSVLFHVIKETVVDLGAKLEISWGFGPELDYSVMLKVPRGAEAPTWVSLQDKYKQRVHVPNMISQRVEDLISQNTGQYWSLSRLTGGRAFVKVFHLTVYGK
jgi:hypothetical protein